MNIQHLAETAASGTAVISSLAVSARWLHRWFTRLENAVSLVEQRSQQLEANGGMSLRDDVRQIRAAVDAHTNEFVAIHQTVSALAVTVATGRAENEEGG